MENLSKWLEKITFAPEQDKCIMQIGKDSMRNKVWSLDRLQGSLEQEREGTGKQEFQVFSEFQSPNTIPNQILPYQFL